MSTSTVKPPHELLLDLQDKAGMTNVELARRLGVTPNVVSMVRKGVMKIPLTWAPVLAAAFGVDRLVFVESIFRTYYPDDWAVILGTDLRPLLLAEVSFPRSPSRTLDGSAREDAPLDEDGDSSHQADD